MLITQNNKSKPLINIDYIHVLYKYLFLHEQIYQLIEITKDHIEKFIVYWFPRVYLDYTTKEIQEIVRNTRIYIEWCLDKTNNDDIKNINFNVLEAELLKIQKKSSKVALIKTKIDRPKVMGKRSIWLEPEEEIQQECEIVSSWFQFIEINSDICILKNIKNNNIYYIDEINQIKEIGLEDEIITLELYRGKKSDKFWRITNIGLIYSRKAKKYLLM